MKSFLLSILILGCLTANAQKGFKVYHAEKARFISFKVNQNIKYNSINNSVYVKDKIISVTDSGFLGEKSGFVRFDSLKSISHYYKYLNLIGYSLIGLTELNLIGAMISADTPVQIAAAFMFVGGNAIVIPYLVYYQKPILKPLNKIGPQTHFILF
ncbi:MAG: hypothetical protein ACEQSR_00400 [Candidatus Methylacidiphilales bacterium]